MSYSNGSTQLVRALIAFVFGMTAEQDFGTLVYKVQLIDTGRLNTFETLTTENVTVAYVYRYREQFSYSGLL